MTQQCLNNYSPEFINRIRKNEAIRHGIIVISTAESHGTLGHTLGCGEGIKSFPGGYNHTRRESKSFGEQTGKG